MKKYILETVKEFSTIWGLLYLVIFIAFLGFLFFPCKSTLSALGGIVLFYCVVGYIAEVKRENKENENLFCDETKQFLNDQLKVDLGNISLSRFSNEPKEFKVSEPNITPNETYYEKSKLDVFLENNKCASCDSEMTHGYCLNGCDDPMGLF